MVCGLSEYEARRKEKVRRGWSLQGFVGFVTPENEEG